MMTSQETEILFDEPSKLVRKKSEVEVQYREKPTFQFTKGALFQKSKSLRDWISQD